MEEISLSWQWCDGGSWKLLRLSQDFSEQKQHQLFIRGLQLSIFAGKMSILLASFGSPFLTKEETTTAEWKDKGRSNSFLRKVQIGYESFIWVQLLTRVPTSHLNETTQYKYSMQELFSFRYIFFLSTFFYNFVHTV